MPCGKLMKSFVFNEFHGAFHVHFAYSSWFVHILGLPFFHAMRPSCTYHCLRDV